MSRPLRGGVDRNARQDDVFGAQHASPPSRGRGSKLRQHPGQPAHRLSPPSRGRGSKQQDRLLLLKPLDEVAPFAGAWIETLPCSGIRQMDCRSPPSRGRGSKQNLKRGRLKNVESPPSRGRGSKRRNRRHHRSPYVAPFAGAWIETLISDAARRQYFGRPLRGGVDRNSIGHRVERGIVFGRPLRGGVDRNSQNVGTIYLGYRRPLRGGVDRNTVGIVRKLLDAGRPLRGGVDRNLQDENNYVACKVAPFAGAWIETPLMMTASTDLIGRPLRGGVDRNSDGVNKAFPANTSPPSRGRGSKRPSLRLLDVRGRSPLRGGWIETNAPRLARRPSQVAPFAGAWIETSPSGAPG